MIDFINVYKIPKYAENTREFECLEFSSSMLERLPLRKTRGDEKISRDVNFKFYKIINSEVYVRGGMCFVRETLREMQRNDDCSWR